MITKEMKISEILKKYPQTLEVFVRISPHFKKLENKILRKALASRVNVEQAASIAGVDLNYLLSELNKSINSIFEPENEMKNNSVSEKQINQIEQEIQIEKKFPNEKIVQLDVRPILNSGKDPFNDIMKKIKDLKDDETLLIINSFEPIPLYSVLGRKGFDHFTQKEGDVFKVYFFKLRQSQGELSSENLKKDEPDLNNFEKVVELDVRDLPPPEPMIKILEMLSQIDEQTVLLVHHHREPIMLYPKLEERGYEAISYKIDDNYFKVLITKKRTENE
ncbi:MAG: DUF2249 domain-containing protein [Ignavibacteria bacterium]